MSVKLPNLIKSTAGAVPVLNEKGELTMEKVKVTRYISGRRPEYAPSDSESESSEDEEGFVTVGGGGAGGEEEEKEGEERGEGPEEAKEAEPADGVIVDRRLRRLRERQTSAGERRRDREIEEPEVLFEAQEEDDDDGDDDEEEEQHHHHLPAHRLTLSDSESEGEELDDEAIERRRAMIREKAKKRALEDDILDVIDEAEQIESEESSEYEEYSDSEDETGPRLKPVFVRKMDRVTIREREEIENEEERLEKDKQRQADLRKKESRRLVEQAVARELQAEQGASSVDKVVNTDDENEEEEYEAWKVRELKRMKRDREERENQEKDRDEIEKLHNMTEEERRAYLRNQPKLITNKQMKGKYKFLQKYYHRGVFYLDEEDDLFRRDFGQATLEDHFDKTVLPKVMQVKDFGRAGRTKYTHLVDQDTTEYESAWSQTNPINLKFQNKGGGTRQVFEKPSYKKRKIG